ncbi:hypothetical protein DNI29_21215 [Hymenobacter sediminis]|uniref:hypothetical protein n=1 Tax=Hymenobacter sediminis TaxID=2218621 RepID=UPI000DA69EA9|nr:hypothetical protein [Hymenobacter sediminis]RPD44651.1 hypothetical protein DNI29_21215 [Hymenobacter sediminis]
MTRLLLPLLSLTLLTTACKKENAQPEPTPGLEGSWQEQAYQEVIRYNTDGIVRSESGPLTLAAPALYSFSGSTLTVKQDGTTRDFTYTRQGDDLNLLATDQPSPDPYKLTIAQLTKTELTLHYKVVVQQQGYSVTISRFTRK